MLAGGGMSPSDIEVLIWCHCRAETHPRIKAPAVNGAIQQFLSAGLIEAHDHFDFYITTDRGAAHINQLCSVEWPTQAWIDNNGNVID